MIEHVECIVAVSVRCIRCSLPLFRMLFPT